MNRQPALRRLVRGFDLRRAGPVALLSYTAASGNLLAGVITARGLGPQDRGLVAVMVTSAALVGVFSTLGTNVVYRAQAQSVSRPSLLQYAKVSLILGFFVGVPALVATAAFVGVLVDPRAWTPSGVALLCGFGIVNFAWFQSSEAMRAHGGMRRAATFDVIGSWSQFLGVAVLALLEAVTVQFVLSIYICSFAVQFLASASYLRVHRVGASRDVGEEWRVRHLLAAGPKYLGFHFGQDLVYRLDRILLGALSTTQAVGLYVIAATPAELMRRPVLAVAQYAMLDASSARVEFFKLLKRAAVWTMALLALCLVGWPLAPMAISVIYGPEYSGAVDPFRILMLAQVALVPYLIFSRALAGARQGISSSVSALVGLVLLVTLGVLLMPTWGANGAALACLAAFGSMSLLSGLLLWRGRADKRGS